MPTVGEDALELVISDSTDNAGRATEYQRARRENFPLCHQRVRADDAPCANHAPVEDGRTHPHQDPVLDGAAVQDDTMAHCYILPYDRGRSIVRVDGTVVLDIAAGAERNPRDVAAKDSIEPHACPLAENDLPNQVRPRSDKRGLVHARPLVAVGVKRSSYSR